MMNLTFTHPLNGDLELKDYPEPCYLAVMSSDRYKSNKFSGTVVLCIEAHILKSDKSPGYRVFCDESKNDLVNQLADDPMVIGAFSSRAVMQEFMNFLAENEPELH